MSPRLRGDGAVNEKVRAILRMQGEYDLPLHKPAGPGRRLHMHPILVAFGEGVKLKRITVEVTDDRVTTGIEERSGWLRLQSEGCWMGEETIQFGPKTDWPTTCLALIS